MSDEQTKAIPAQQAAKSSKSEGKARQLPSPNGGTTTVVGVGEQSGFMAEAHDAALEFGEAASALSYLGVQKPTFEQIVDFIEKYRDYSRKYTLQDQEVQLSYDERQLAHDKQKGAQQLSLDKQMSEQEERAREMDLRYQRESSEEKRNNFEARLRGILAMVLVVALLAAITVGLFKEMAPDQLTQYVAPISGLAGIAIGYFFGRSKA